MEAGGDSRLEAKVVVLGETNVGKTCMVLRCTPILYFVFNFWSSFIPIAMADWCTFLSDRMVNVGLLPFRTCLLLSSSLFKTNFFDVLCLDEASPNTLYGAMSHSSAMPQNMVHAVLDETEHA